MAGGYELYLPPGVILCVRTSGVQSDGLKLMFRTSTTGQHKCSSHNQSEQEKREPKPFHNAPLAEYEAESRHRVAWLRNSNVRARRVAGSLPSTVATRR